MSYQDFFTTQGLTSIQAFYDYAQSNFHFGWMDQRGNYHHEANTANGYALQSPSELMKSQIGNCWDLAELYRCWFSNMTNLPTETYFIFYDDYAGCPSHAILSYPQAGKFYWFEPMFGDNDCDYSGIHSYDGMKELLTDFRNQFIQISLIRGTIPEAYLPEQIKLYRYQKPQYLITGAEMRNHIDKSELVAI